MAINRIFLKYLDGYKMEGEAHRVSCCNYGGACEAQVLNDLVFLPNPSTSVCDP
jgi:hypothetical protein